MGFRSGAKRCTYEATASPAGGRSSLAAESFPRVRFHQNGCGGKGPVGQVSIATGLDLRNNNINANVDF